MQTPTPPPSATTTCKRKRLDTDSAPYSFPSPTRLKTTELSSRSWSHLDGESTVASESPRATITGHLQELDIQEADSAVVSKLDFGMGKRKNDTSTGIFAPQVLLPKNQSYNDNDDNHFTNSKFRPVTPPSGSSGPERSTNFHARPPPQNPYSPVSPGTSQCPLPSTTITDLVSSNAPNDPPAIPTPDPRLGNKSPVHTDSSSSSSDPSIFSSTTTTTSSSSSASLWWLDTEITGHNPSDPTDDGYGINGVGFVPTPAMANARAEKRRKQVKEWKEREAREARARRGARRQRGRGGNNGIGNGNGIEGDTKVGVGFDGEQGSMEEEGGIDTKTKGPEGGRKEVRFSDVMEVEVG